MKEIEQLEETAAALLTLANKLRADEKPAPPQEGPTEENKGFMLGWGWRTGASECDNLMVAKHTHANGLWAPTKDDCEALGSRLIMQAKRGPMPKDGDWIVKGLFPEGKIMRFRFNPHHIPDWYCGLVRINTPENCAELEQTLREHGRGLGIEVER